MALVCCSSRPHPGHESWSSSCSSTPCTSLCHDLVVCVEMETKDLDSLIFLNVKFTVINISYPLLPACKNSLWPPSHPSAGFVYAMTHPAFPLDSECGDFSFPYNPNHFPPDSCFDLQQSVTEPFPSEVRMLVNIPRYSFDLTKTTSVIDS